jgi:hypothetical protein
MVIRHGLLLLGDSPRPCSQSIISAGPYRWTVSEGWTGARGADGVRYSTLMFFEGHQSLSQTSAQAGPDMTTSESGGGDGPGSRHRPGGQTADRTAHWAALTRGPGQSLTDCWHTSRDGWGRDKRGVTTILRYTLPTLLSSSAGAAT